MNKVLGLGILVAGMALAACGGGGSAIPNTVPTMTIPTPVSVTTNQASIAGDLLPPPNGQIVTYATCVPVFNLLSYDNNGPVRTGCVTTFTAALSVNGVLQHYWIINGNTNPNLDCIIQYYVNTNDVTEFECRGNPFV
jgi:hypothetical protein